MSAFGASHLGFDVVGRIAEDPAQHLGRLLLWNRKKAQAVHILGA